MLIDNQKYFVAQNFVAWKIACILAYCNWISWNSSNNRCFLKSNKKKICNREKKNQVEINRMGYFFIMNKIKHDKLGMCCMPTQFHHQQNIHISVSCTILSHGTWVNAFYGFIWIYTHKSHPIRYGMASLKSKNSDSDSVWERNEDKKNEWDERKLNRFNYFQYT